MLIDPTRARFVVESLLLGEDSTHPCVNSLLGCPAYSGVLLLMNRSFYGVSPL
jgi:hypothetical protein